MATVSPPVVAIIDSGINPYHMDFRAASDRHADPRRIPGYPEDARELGLSLDLNDLATAIDKDRSAWEAVEPGVLYFVPGTRIAGAVYFSERSTCAVSACNPYAFLDGDGHGTAVASAGFGNANGTFPDAWIVAIHGSNIDAAMSWAAGQEWIDVITVSLGDMVTDVTGLAENSWAWSITGRTWFNSAGNGGNRGLYTMPSGFSGPPWVVPVGQLDAETTLGGGPGGPAPFFTRGFKILAEGHGWFAKHDGIDTFRSTGGTSFSSPRAAGHYARLLWEAWRILADQDGYENGTLAQAAPGIQLPAYGPLADGRLDHEELESIIKRTARWIPYLDGQPGWPNPELDYLFIGYGLVDNVSEANALDALRGETQLPDRPWDRYWEAYYDSLAGNYWMRMKCNHAFFGIVNSKAYTTCMQDASGAYGLPPLPPPE